MIQFEHRYMVLIGEVATEEDKHQVVLRANYPLTRNATVPLFATRQDAMDYARKNAGGCRCLIAEITHIAEPTVAFHLINNAFLAPNKDVNIPSTAVGIPFATPA